MVDIAKRRATVLMIMLGTFMGSAGGVAYANFEHTSGLWNHGRNNEHIYMTRTDGGASEGVVAPIYTLYCGGGTAHGSETRYSANHVHVDGNSGVCNGVFEGHFSSPGPYLGHHGHG